MAKKQNYESMLAVSPVGKKKQHRASGKELDVDTIIGIDPGASGGIAVHHCKEGKTEAWKMPKDLERVRDIIHPYSGGRTLVLLEKLAVRRDDLIITQGSDTASLAKVYRIQKMLANYEQLKTLLDLEDVPYSLIHPMSWQTTLGVRSHGRSIETKAERKRRYRRIAADRFTSLRVTLYTADALLMVMAGERIVASNPLWFEFNMKPERFSRLVKESPVGEDAGKEAGGDA